MIPVLIKEISGYLSSLTGYAAICIFLAAAGIFVWVVPGYSIPDMGFASLDVFFGIAPQIFLFLIPAITMRSFAEERKTGTFELLATKPITDSQIIAAKFFASVILVALSLAPTLFYFYSVWTLGSPAGNMDTGAAWGSYAGLLLLGASFAAIGIFSSSLTESQVTAFLVSVFLCYLFYMGFENLSGLEIFYGRTDSIIKNIGMNEHYISISRGVADTRDIVYFLSVQAGFLAAARLVLQSRNW